ncbi:MAG: hypothetical protein ACW991_05165 [Candidatus Hodarchaeales archaeon]|jgi:hypothetical protein
MKESGISVKDTGKGLQLTLDGEMYRIIAQNWEQGKLKPFFSHLKEFIRQLEKDYGS